MGLRTLAKIRSFSSISLSAFDDFLDKYPTSRYVPFVQTMQVRFVLGQNELNRGIVNVYKKQKKPEAVQKYLDRIDDDLESNAKPKPSYIPEYVRMFNW